MSAPRASKACGMFEPLFTTYANEPGFAMVAGEAQPFVPVAAHPGTDFFKSAFADAGCDCEMVAHCRTLLVPLSERVLRVCSGPDWQYTLHEVLALQTAGLEWSASGRESGLQ